MVYFDSKFLIMYSIEKFVSFAVRPHCLGQRNCFYACDLLDFFQAAELQNLDGLAVYNQETLEAEILKQVDDALEGGINKSDDEAERELGSQEFNVNNLIKNESDMERSIRLGEMTPFGTVLNGSAGTAFQ